MHEMGIYNYFTVHWEYSNVINLFSHYFYRVNSIFFHQRCSSEFYYIILTTVSTSACIIYSSGCKTAR